VTIFVSIASYRDSQLGPTVRDCLEKADRPQDLRFGICWQHAPDELWPLDDDPRFQVIDVDYLASRGVCWARSRIAGLVGDEDWYLQLDSHHRFAPGWDTELIAVAEAAPSAKPLITTYPTGFRVPDDGVRNPVPWQMSFGRWSPEGIPLFQPVPVPDWENLNRPLRARFLGACLVFTRPQWVIDVPYDQDIYFSGEEITLAIRSFTSGYDLFHPQKTLVWHEWSRSYRPQHAGDHVPKNGAVTPWWELQARSNRRVRDFLRAPYTGKFGCGTERSFADYEAYSGLDLSKCRTQEYTLRNLEPPNPPAEPSWSDRPRPWRVVVNLKLVKLEPRFLAPDSVWELRFLDSDGELIEAATLSGQNRARHGDDDDSIAVERSFSSARTPVSWTLSTREEGGKPVQVGGAIMGGRRQFANHFAYIAV
jgi:Glycosyltransferase (GlcNAc)